MRPRALTVPGAFTDGAQRNCCFEFSFLAQRDQEAALLVIRQPVAHGLCACSAGLLVFTVLLQMRMGCVRCAVVVVTGCHIQPCQ